MKLLAKHGFVVLLAATLFSCSQKRKADLLVYHASIYTVDSTFLIAEAMVIRDGLILETGKTSDLQERYDATESYDAGGRFIYPGLIDAHAHFIGYALSLQTADLTGTHSWNEVLERLRVFAHDHPDGWLIGRGWDQNDWEIKDFPTNDSLNRLFPGRPVLLERVDGHAAIVNQVALDTAGIRAGDQISGGEIGVISRAIGSSSNGSSSIGSSANSAAETADRKLSGVLIDNAMGLVSKFIPQTDETLIRKAVLEAQANCFAMGLTTIDDCGLDIAAVEGIRSMQDSGALKMKMYVMLSDDPANFAYLEKNGTIKTERLNVRSIKVYADGALGSRGACLLQPYSDKPGYSGFLLSTQAHFDSVATRIAKNGWQMCTHAIGDSGNRTILNIYASHLKGKNGLRWRIEHAQVIDASDFHLFGENSVVPSVQPTHATSDMYWASQRLGAQRVKTAYAYQQLLKENGWLPLGTDFPVENISPFRTFHSAVFRKDEQEWPATGFQPENALTPEQALRGMTIWAARANFEENEKGSLEPGKFADFIILDHDLLKAASPDVLSMKVFRTYSSGELVFERR